MRKIEFTEDDYKKIVDMYTKGMSAEKIGETYGCSQRPIVRVLHECNINLDTVLRKIPKSDYDKIIDMYNNGMTQKEIAMLYNCDQVTVGSLIKKLNVPTRPNGFTSEQAREMYDMWNDGKSMDKIALIYNTDRHTIGRVLKRNGYKIDRLKYHCNGNYFDNIDNADKAYILGLLWSDGCNYLSLGKIQLQLQEKDKHILNDINILIDNDRPLTFLSLNDQNPTWQNTYTLILKSYHMSKILNDYGMTPRKSLTLEFPTWLDTSLYSHFLRGYIDGDGSICYRVDMNSCRVSIIGTKMFLDVVQNILLQLGVKCSLYHKNGQSDVTYTLHTTSNSGSVKLLNWIYDDAHLKLERKYDKYQQFLSNSINNSLVG